jgi:hypothetical protein
MKIFWIFGALTIYSLSLAGQEFRYSASCQKGYEAIFKLKFQEGKDWLLKARQEDPNNLLVDYIENYVDFLALYISEDDDLFKRLSGNKDKRIIRMQGGSGSSPYFLYTQASLNLQWAFIRIKHGAYFQALLEIRKAHQLLKENKEKFPDFRPNDKDLALLNTLFGAIPDKYKGGAKLLGLKGDIGEGLQQMAALIKDPAMPFRDETLIMYTMLLLHLGKDQDGAWQMIHQLNIPLGDNLLNHFIVSTVSLYTGKNDHIIEVLNKRPTGSAYYPFPFLDYMMGIAKLNRLDQDADQYLQKFIKAYKGSNYLREAYRKLAWHHLLNNRPMQYHQCMSQLLLIGNEQLDGDKAASIEARSGQKPHLGLLKARLLSDGGYYTRALEVLESLRPTALTERDELEYYYRKARITDDMGKAKSAIPYYEATIRKGEFLPIYYAPNACIKLGRYYELSGDKEKSVYYYKKALGFSKHEYKNSIDAEAKAGLNRLSAK